MYTHLSAIVLLVWFSLSFPQLIQVLSPMEGNESNDLSKLNRAGRTIGQTKDEQPEFHASRVEEVNEHSEACTFTQIKRTVTYQRTVTRNLLNLRTSVPKKEIFQKTKPKKEASSCQLGNHEGSVADYPLKLQLQALEFVNLLPRAPITASSSEPPSEITAFTSSCRVM